MSFSICRQTVGVNCPTGRSTSSGSRRSAGANYQQARRGGSVLQQHRMAQQQVEQRGGRRRLNGSAANGVRGRARRAGIRCSSASETSVDRLAPTLRSASPRAGKTPRLPVSAATMRHVTPSDCNTVAVNCSCVAHHWAVEARLCAHPGEPVHLPRGHAPDNVAVPERPKRSRRSKTPRGVPGNGDPSGGASSNWTTARPCSALRPGLCSYISSLRPRRGISE